MKSLKTDLEQDEVFVFTPKGRVVTLPVGSTTVDFAYAVHTEVGHACIGAKVNGRLVSLDHTVSSGDTCEIFTSKVETAGPSQDWLGFVKSPRARNKIRQWFSRERRLDMIEQGRDELAEELRREGLPVQRMWASDQLKTVIDDFSYLDLDALLAADRRAPRVGPRCRPARRPRLPRRRRRGAAAGDGAAAAPPPHRSPTRSASTSRASTTCSSRLAQCCTPVPGDEIIGFVTRGRGVSVHRADCANAVTLMSDHATRMIDVDWDGETSGAVFRAGVEVVALDRSRLLRDVANALSDHHVNIVACDTNTGSDRVAKMRFEFELADPNHLAAVLRTIKGIDAVYDAYRLVPGGSADALKRFTAATSSSSAVPTERTSAQPLTPIPPSGWRNVPVMPRGRVGGQEHVAGGVVGRRQGDGQRGARPQLVLAARAVAERLGRRGRAPPARAGRCRACRRGRRR